MTVSNPVTFETGTTSREMPCAASFAMSSRSWGRAAVNSIAPGSRSWLFGG